MAGVEWAGIQWGKVGSRKNYGRAGIRVRKPGRGGATGIWLPPLKEFVEKPVVCRPLVNHVDSFEPRETKNGTFGGDSPERDAAGRLNSFPLFGRYFAIELS